MKFQIESHLTPQGKKTYIAKSKPSGILSEDEVYQKMSRNSEIESVEAEKYMNLFAAVLKEAIRNGYAVQTTMGKFTPQLTGTFEGAEDKYSPKKHKIRVSFTPKKGFLTSLQVGVKPKKVLAQTREPWIQEITNASRPNAKIFKNNDLIQLRGQNLKIHPKHNDTKLELIPSTKGKLPIAVPIHQIPVHEHRKVLFQLYNIPKGVYTIRIAALVGRKVLIADSEEKMVVG
jgi:hypothetical protein